MLSHILTDPSSALQALSNDHTELDQLPKNVSAHFQNLFKSQDDFSQIPTLSVHHPPYSFPDRSLVAFRAMVQDTSSSPEIYLARRQNGQYGGWGIVDDSPHQSSDLNYNDLRECTVFWAVSIPGESPWCSATPNVPVTTNSIVPVRPHKYPLSDIPYVGAQVKIYDLQQARQVKATDLFTFVGILSHEPIHGGFDSDSSESVPTLHVLYFMKTPPTIIPRIYPSVHVSSHSRDQLIQWIAEEALAGDTHAAEWTLLTAIAKTQSRTPPIYPPSLTLSSFPNPTSGTTLTPTIHHVLASILPIVNTLPLSLESLNTNSYFPESKNEDLHSGILQVPRGTVFLISEGGINEGSIMDKGIQNLRALQNAMTGQILDYAFPFSRYTFETDVSFMVLTGGKKSTFFQTTLNVPLEPAKEQEYDLYKPLDQIKLPSKGVLNSWRELVGSSKNGSVGVSEDAAAYIQEDFVQERKASNAAITHEDLAHRMIIARLLALSYHEKSVTKEIWEKTKTLEATRKAKFY